MTLARGDGDGISGAGGPWSGIGGSRFRISATESGEIDTRLSSCLGGNKNLGGLAGGEGIVHWQGFGFVVAAEIAELLVLGIDLGTGADVDEERYRNDNPGHLRQCLPR